MNLRTSLLLHGKCKWFAVSILMLITIVIASCKKDDKQAPPTIPVVTTAAQTIITAAGAIQGGSIVGDGARGVAATSSHQFQKII